MDMEGKSHLCAICGKGFPYTSKLKKHMATTHTVETPFQCPECGQRFKREAYLMKHQKRHTSDKPFVCPICGVGCTDADSLEEHVNGHTSQQAHVCPECGRGFNQLGNMKKHLQTHSKDKPYACKLCGKGFRDPSGVRRHERNFHREKERFVCTVCNRECSNLPNLQRHMASHEAPKPRECEVCQEMFPTLQRLQTHMRKFHTEKVAKVLPSTECPECGKDFATVKSMKKHIQRHSGETPHVCKECGKKLFSPGALRKHMMIHTGEKPFQCSVCSNAYRSNIDLKYHMMTHTGETRHECQYCKKGFIHKSNLKRHVMKHTGYKSHECSDCGRRFTYLHHLRRHKKSHTGELPYKCSECGKRFGLPGNLKRHILIHTAEKKAMTMYDEEYFPYVCEKCGKGFKFPSVLRIHMETHRKGKMKKKYVCPVCSKRFPQKCNLAQHMLIHTGVRKHLCSECGRTFLRADQLKSHLRSHTGETPFQCELCGKKFRQKNGLNAHMISHEMDKAEQPHVCRKCGLGFINLIKLNEHTKEQHPELAKDIADVKPDINLKQQEETQSAPVEQKTSRESGVINHDDHGSNGDDGGTDLMNHYDSETDVDEIPDTGTSILAVKVKSEIPTEAELDEMFPANAKEALKACTAENHQARRLEMRALWYQAAIMRNHIEPWAAGITEPPDFLIEAQEKTLLENIARERQESAMRIMKMTKDFLVQAAKDQKDAVEVSYGKVESLTSLNHSESTVAASMAALKSYNTTATQQETKLEYSILDDMMRNIESRYPGKHELMDPATAAYSRFVECKAQEQSKVNENHELKEEVLN